MSNGTSTISAANVTNVIVTCSANNYTIGGMVAGLGIGKTVILQNNSKDDLAITLDGSFTFSTAITACI